VIATKIAARLTEGRVFPKTVFPYVSYTDTERPPAAGPTAFRDLNQGIVNFVRAGSSVELLCECGDDYCMERVVMTREIFEEIVERDGRVLAPGHG
jgi:hypothetical protein